MGSTSKSVTLSMQCELGSDRISSLPCDIRSHILSFLSTKEAVSTSILSTKWKDTWHSLTKLDINDENSPCLLIFTTLLYRLLLRHKGLPLSEFRLSCKKKYDCFHVNAWIDAVLLCKIQQLNISISLKKDSSLSKEIFSSATLVVLKLNASFLMSVPMSVCLPCLKVVDLSFVQFLVDDLLTRFICGCPVLDELTLSRCIGENVREINIVSPLLTKLVLEDMPIRGTQGFSNRIMCKIVIDTPCLKYLEMNNYFAHGCLVKDLHNLIEARATFSPLFLEIWTMRELFKGFSNVGTLHLSCRGLLRNWPQAQLKFPKLTYLELIMDRECAFLSEMLENSPCLETLVYKEVVRNADLQPRSFYCSSLSTNLRVIVIEVLVGLKTIRNMLLFFTNYAMVLEKLIVQTKFTERLEDELETVKYFLENDQKIKKLTVEYVKDSHLRRLTLDYTS